MERPLKKIKESVLRALHVGIKWSKGLVSDHYYKEDVYGCRVCAIGAMGRTRNNSIKMALKHGLIRGDFGFTCLTDDGFTVEALNFKYDGLPKGRRKFMMGHIAKELKQRGLSLTRSAKSSSAPKRKQKVLVKEGGR